MDDGIIVFGAGGHAKVVISTLLAVNMKVGRVVDNDPAKWGGTILGFTVSGPDDPRALEGRQGIIAIGDNRTRKNIVEIGRAHV